jgi:hypothetical protein
MGGGAVKTPEQKLDDALEAERLAGNLVAWHEYYNPARFGSPSVGSSLTGLTISDRTAAGNDAVASGTGPTLRQSSGVYYVEINGIDDALTMALPARRNLLTYTEDFSNGVWARTNVTTASDTVRETATSGEHFIETVVSETGNVTLSVEVKAVERDQIRVLLGTVSGTYGLVYTFSSDTISSTGSAIIASSSEVLSDGWVRIVMTSNSGANRARVQLTEALANVYTGDAAKGVDVRRAQLETGSTATDYQSVGSDWMDDMLVSIAFRTSDTTGLLVSSDSQSRWLGAIQDGSSSTNVAANGSGSPSIRLDGVASAFATRDALHASAADGQWHIATFVGADLSSWADIVLGFYGASDAFNTDYDIVGLVVAPNTTENIELAEAALAKAMEPVGYALAS